MIVRPSNFMFNEETAVSNKFQVKECTITADDNFDLSSSIPARALSEFDYFADILKSKGVNVITIDDTTSPVKPDAVFPNNWVTFHIDNNSSRHGNISNRDGGATAAVGKVLLYPMCAPNRRHERRLDAVNRCVREYQLLQQSTTGLQLSAATEVEVIDLSVCETKGVYMEGTGSMLFDHLNRIIYCCLSIRASVSVLQEVCRLLGYTFVVFRAVDVNGFPIYHTNVMLAIGEKYAVVCADAIELVPAPITAEELTPCVSGTDTAALEGNTINVSSSSSGTASLTSSSSKMTLSGRETVLSSLAGTLPGMVHQREVVLITPAQMNSFAGNMLELFGTTVSDTSTTDCDVTGLHQQSNLSGEKKSYLMMSKTAHDSLTVDQIARLSIYSELVSIPVPTIEKYGGGSIRCMICEVR